MNSIVPQQQDGFDLAATPLDPTTMIRAPILKHVKGVLEIYGRTGGTLPLGSKFLGHAIRQGWVHLEKGKPARRIPREAGKHFPTRDELGELDRNAWPIGPGGTPSDPWTLESAIHLTLMETGQDYIFTTNNITGRNAVEEFAQGVRWQRMFKGANAKPILEIGSSSYEGRYGRVAVPTFTIVDWWISPEGETAPPVQDNQALSPPVAEITPPRPRRVTRETKPAPARTRTAADLNDEIPF
jgi:hypothetical protein